MRTITIFFFAFAGAFPWIGSASELAYVKTDSPRDTMETFIRAMNDYRQGVLENSKNKKDRIQDAIRCFSEKNTNILTTRDEKEQAAIFLKEVIDRVLVIDFSKIPNTNTDHRWRLKHTEIVLKPQKEGEREGEWLITENSWKRARDFYQRVKDKAYLKGSGQGALYSSPLLETYLPQWSKGKTFSLKNWQWIGLFLGFLIGICFKILSGFILGLYRKLKFTQTDRWQTKLAKKLENPFGFFIMALFWYGWVRYLKLEGLSLRITNGFIQIIFGITIIWAIYCCVDLFGIFFKGKVEKEESSLLKRELVPFLEKILKTVVVLFGFLVILQNMGVNVFSLLAGLGLGGLAFALAAKDTAANLFGSIMILTDIPFKIGDWVLIDEIEGTVEEIGFRSTRIRTFYNSLVTVPNANIANAKIDNMGERSFRRVNTHLDIAYNTTSDKIEEFIDGIRQIIRNHSSTRKDGYHVYFTDYGESSLKIKVYFFFIAEDWGKELKHRQDVFLKIFNLADQLKIEFAYPTKTLYLKKELSQSDQSESHF